MEKNKIENCKVLIIGGSAGSLEVLMNIFPNLKPISSFSIVIVLHRKNSEDNMLEELFALKTQIPVKGVEDKTPLESGFIYIAPSDYHLLFEKSGLLSLDISEKVNFSRPSIDVSFESASEVYGSNLIGILLSGSNSDGTQGLIAIKDAGGKIIIQDPENSKMPFMPKNALSNTSPDFILNENEILQFILSINSQ